MQGRFCAARICAWLGPDGKSAVTALAKALKDPSYQVKLAAVTSLGSMGPAATEAVGALEELSNGGEFEGDFPNLAAEALKKIRK